VDKQTLINYWKENYTFTIPEFDAFNEIDREDFILPELREIAYQDRPLPILRGKTISQPTTVMIMTHALELNPGDKVFEVGSGSGYQTALISKLIGSKGKIITTEVLPELFQLAKNNLTKTKIINFEIYEADGSKGMKDKSPFDKIMITAACNDFPEELLEQLKSGGIIVAPIGNKDEQNMLKGIKQADGSLEIETLGSFLFSPLYGIYGFEV